MAVDRGLRHGVLVDLQRRALAGDSDQSIGGAARVLGRRFYFDERHASQVARIALQLFDELAEIHKLPAVGAAVPGGGGAAARPGQRRQLPEAPPPHPVPDPERRHPRAGRSRAGPGRAHRPLPPAQPARARPRRHGRADPGRGAHWCASWPPCCGWRTPWIAATTSPSPSVRPRRSNGEISLRIKARAPVDLELWDVAHEAPLFRQGVRQALQLGSRPGVTGPGARLLALAFAGRAGRWPRLRRPAGRSRSATWLARRAAGPPRRPAGARSPGGGREAGAHGAATASTTSGAAPSCCRRAARATSPRPRPPGWRCWAIPTRRTSARYPLARDGAAGRWSTSTTSIWPGTGPYLRRSAPAGAGPVGGGDMADLGKKQRVRLVEALCEGYLDEIARAGPGRTAAHPARRRRRSTVAWRRSWPTRTRCEDGADGAGRGRPRTAALLGQALLRYRATCSTRRRCRRTHWR